MEYFETEKVIVCEIFILRKRKGPSRRVFYKKSREPAHGIFSQTIEILAHKVSVKLQGIQSKGYLMFPTM